MKLLVILCLAALAFDGLEAGNAGRQKAGASMQTSYIGKLHEMNSHGHEECVGTFSGSTTFEQPSDCCWSSFAEKCKEFLGGLVNILSTSASCNPCGKGCTSIDLDMKSRITKPSTHPQCEIHSPAHPVYKQVVYQPQEHCGGDCDSHHRHHHTVYKPVVYQSKESCGDDCEQPRQQIVQPSVVQQPVQSAIVQPAIVQPTIVQQPVQPAIVQQPVYPPVVEQVQVVPVKETCDDCDEKKHKHHRHHKHHHHKHHHHKHHHKEDCEDDCD